MDKKIEINELLNLLKLYYEKTEIYKSSLGEQNYKIISKEINKLAIKINKFSLKIEKYENFLRIYYEIILEYPYYMGNIAIRLRLYESNLAKKMYQRFYNMDVEKNFFAKYILDNRESEIEKSIKSEEVNIEKYIARKNKNPEEYKTIMAELNSYLDKF